MAVEQDVLRWYTPALRIPKFLGKLPSGERLPGGPYTQAQGATFATVVVVAGVTRQWWSVLLPQGPWWGLGSYLIVLALAVAAGLAARVTPRTSMNPVAIARGAVGQILRSTSAPGRARRGVVRGLVTITSNGAPPMREVRVAEPAAVPTSSVAAGQATWGPRPATAPTAARARPVAGAGGTAVEGGPAAKLADLVAGAVTRSGSDPRLLEAAGRS